MSPELLADYLARMKASGAMLVTVTIPLQYGKDVQVATISAQFPPEVEPLPQPAEPGGWKRADLDKGFEP